MQEPLQSDSGIVRARTARGVMLYDASRTGNFVEAQFEPPWWIEHGAIDGQARGRGNTLFVSAGDRRYALRHYRRGGLPGKLFDDGYLYLGAERTRPLREWRLTHRLHGSGLPVPAPVAARFIRTGHWYSGDLITERIAGARSLAGRLVDGPLPLADWVAVGRCIRRFHDAGVCHADLNAHNVLFDGDARVFLVDFDRCGLRSPGLWSDANLVRLRRSLLKISDSLPDGHFSETDWQTLMSAYADSARAAARSSSLA